MLVLHGIYGSGANWRTFARRLVERCPGWGVSLVDLRMHGQSLGAPPPHSVTAAAADLEALTAALGGQGKPVRAVLGHSFGGKVALAYRAASGQGLVQTWVIDASPAARPEAMNDPDNTVARVLEVLRALPPAFSSRDDFVQRVEAHGVSSVVAQWLAMNLERRDGRYESRLDPAAMKSLLGSYYTHDAWSAVESGPGDLHVVVAGRSSALSAGDRQRLADIAAQNPSVQVTTIEESGHWVHVEAPDALLEVVARGTPPC